MLLDSHEVPLTRNAPSIEERHPDTAQEKMGSYEVFPLSGVNHDNFCSVTGCTERIEEQGMFLGKPYNTVTAVIMKQERRRLTGRRKMFDLSMYLSLPSELIFEIFGHLHPLDVYHLSHTSKALRAMVITRNASSLWNTVFERHPSVPPPPPEISKPAWAALLFGPAICDECGKRGAVIDFAFRRHFCSSCMDMNYIYQHPHDDESLYEENDIVWDLIPKSYRKSGNHFGGYEEMRLGDIGRYLRRDVLFMEKALQSFRGEIAMGNPGAEAVFENFQITRKAQVASVLKHAEECSLWANGFDEWAYQSYLADQEHIHHRIMNRVIARGYSHQDIDMSDFWDLIFNRLHVDRVTRRVWRNISPTVFEFIHESMEKKRERLAEQRRSIIKATFTKYENSLPPKERLTLPHYDNLLTSDAFSILVESPPRLWRDLVAVSGLVAHWRTQKMRDLLNTVPAAGDLDLNDVESMARKLAFANSVFTRSNCDNTIGSCSLECDPPAGDFTRCNTKNGRCFFGWEDVSVYAKCHMLVSAGGRRLLFSDVGSSAATELVQFLGLDPLATSASDMDDLGARMICGNCAAEEHWSVCGCEVLTWRECVSHMVQMESDETHSTSSWHMLTPVATASVCYKEPMYPNPSDKSWACNHCNMHLAASAKRSQALKHVRNDHSIAHPIEGIDFFHHQGPGSEHTTRQPVILALEPRAEFRCEHCKKTRFRLFAKGAMEQHLLNRHGITNPVFEEDFIKIKLILRSSRSRMTEDALASGKVDKLESAL
ncbi:hypothetical protein Hypma_003937 [Hypsizygus marmoreus]|uniref:F-box domain-containing protein n=1 Tax=Hypsizygus marmoreus TaxID=39966 RepID=A0A369J5I3_HYPMA|nr:hypothetical protein Hypma_003937 [Hypsizygus marmoreus]